MKAVFSSKNCVSSAPSKRCHCMLVTGITLAFALLFWAVSFTSATSLADAIQWWYDQGLTKYSTSSSFRAYDTMRRDEAAKFFVEFMDAWDYRNSIYTRGDCYFSDLRRASSDLLDYISDACHYNIVRGSNGKFLPDHSLTNAQAVTIVVRIIDGWQSESGGTHWADKYYKRAKELWLDISRFSAKDNPATRGNVMMLVYDAAHGGDSSTWESSGDKDFDKILKSLTDILDE